MLPTNCVNSTASTSGAARIKFANGGVDVLVACHDPHAGNLVGIACNPFSTPDGFKSSIAVEDGCNSLAAVSGSSSYPVGLMDPVSAFKARRATRLPML